jgi:hypothetical protein
MSPAAQRADYRKGRADWQAMYDAGCTDRQMADAANVPRRVVSSWRYVRGLPCHRAIKEPAGDDAMWRAYRAGLTDTAIADTVDTTRSCVVRWRRARGLAPHLARRLPVAEMRRELAVPGVDPAGIFARWDLTLEQGLALVGERA